MTRTNRDWDALADAETGRLDRVMMQDVLVRPPGVERKGAALIFETPLPWDFLATVMSKRGVVEVPTVPVRRDLLEKFLGLSTDQAVLRFARLYGSIRGYGASDYAVLAENSPILTSPDRILRRSRAGDPFEEPFEVWYRCRDRFDAVLALAAGWKEGNPDRAVLERIAALGIKDVNPKMLNTVATRQREAAWTLSWWANWAGRSAQLRPSLRFHHSGRQRQSVDLLFRDGFSDTYGIGISLHGALVVQMLGAISGSGFVTCSSCGSAFMPSRRPTQARRRYCRDCGRRAALRDAKAAQRERERGNVDRDLGKG